MTQKVSIIEVFLLSLQRNKRNSSINRKRFNNNLYYGVIRQRKKAIMHAIKCMMAADGVIDSNETELLNKICLMMHVEQNEFDQVLTMSHEDAMSILKDMSQDKRNMVALLLQDMAKADGLVDKTERMYFIKVNKELNFTNLKNI